MFTRAYRYAILVLRTGIAYRYCVPVRTCKHRLTLCGKYCKSGVQNTLQWSAKKQIETEYKTKSSLWGSKTYINDIHYTHVQHIIQTLATSFRFIQSWLTLGLQSYGYKVVVGHEVYRTLSNVQKSRNVTAILLLERIMLIHNENFMRRHCVFRSCGRPSVVCPLTAISRDT